MTLEEAKARILKLYFDDNCFGEDFAIFIDEVYADFDKELDKARREGYVAGGNDCYILLTGKDNVIEYEGFKNVR